MRHYVYLESAAKLAGRAKHFGGYRNLALVEWDDVLRKQPPKIIRACKGVRIILHYGPVYLGGTTKSYGMRLKLELQAKAVALMQYNNPIRQAVQDAVGRKVVV